MNIDITTNNVNKPRVPLSQPFPGLRAFERAEARIFFGRQQQVNELLTRLKQHHFLAVLGSSGSGKSSLMKAGVLPSLEKGYMGEVGARWAIAEMKPGDQPFMRLAEALLADNVFAQVWGGGLSAAATPVTDSAAFLSAELRRGARSLHQILATSPLPSGTRLLLLVDQFEEMFRFKEQEENQAAAFVALLLEACQHEDIYVTITMRSDFLGSAAQFHGLPEAINSGMYLTPRLTREQLREAICLPPQLFEGCVEEPLANHLLNEAGNDPDQLPLLQHALMRLWEGVADKLDKTLSLESYRNANGLRAVLNDHAEQVWKEQNDHQQKMAETMFRALTERSRDGQTIRRPVTVQALCDLLDTDLGNLTPVIDNFRQAGCNFLMPPPQVALTLATVIDISHESLIRHWQSLQNWVAAENKKAMQYQRLLDAAERHKKGECDLWQGTDLTLVLTWETENQPNAVWAARYTGLFTLNDPKAAQGDAFNLGMAFLTASKVEQERQQQEIATQQQLEQEKQKRETKRIRRQLAFSSIGLTLMMILAGWGFSERQNARRAEDNITSLTDVTIRSLAKQDQMVVTEYVQNVFNSGNKPTLLLMLATMIKDTDNMDTIQKKFWNEKLPQLKNSDIARLVELLFIENKTFSEVKATAKSETNTLTNEFASGLEKTYEQAIAVDPKNADNLGDFAVFMTNIRKDYPRAEKLYEQAIAADPKHANNLGSFAIFMKDIRKDYPRAEKLYEQAIAADPKNATNLGNFANFMTDIRKDYPRAEKLYEQAIAAAPKDANILANFAQFKLITGKIKEGKALIDQSFAAKPEQSGTKLELWFYRLAHFPQSYPQAQTEIITLLKNGTRSEYWDFSGNIAQAEKQGHPNLPLLKAFAEVILDKAKLETLAPYLSPPNK